MFSTQGFSPFVAHPSGYGAVREHLPSHKTIEYEGITLELWRIGLALFASTYRNPQTLLFPKELAVPKVVSDVSMTVELAQALYGIDERDEDDRTGLCYDTPEWYIRGTGMFTAKDGELLTAPMHALFRVGVGPSVTAAEICIHTDRLRID